MVLCWGLIDAGRAHRRYMEPRFMIFLSAPHHGHTLVTDSHNIINITIQPYNWTGRDYEKT